jgi:hypothetical protein
MGWVWAKVASGAARSVPATAAARSDRRTRSRRVMEGSPERDERPVLLRRGTAPDARILTGGKTTESPK